MNPIGRAQRAGGHASSGRSGRAPFFSAPFIVGCLLLGALAYLLVTGRSTVVFEGDSDFGTVRVTEARDGLRTLYIGDGRGRQSAIYPGRPMHLELTYTRVAAVGLGLVPPGGRILFVGLGGGAMPMHARQVLPDARIDVVEINPLVVEVAERFFGFTPDDRMRVITDDGRALIENAPPGSWDIIVLDAFSDTEIPMALATRQFLEAVRSRLTPRGIVVSNLLSSNPSYPAMLATYEAVFDQVRLVQVPRQQQRILLAGGAGVPLERSDLVQAARVLCERSAGGGRDLGFDLPDLVGDGYLGPPRVSVPVLDDSLLVDPR